jgi:hypothetical protein
MNQTQTVSSEMLIRYLEQKDPTFSSNPYLHSLVTRHYEGKLGECFSKCQNGQKDLSDLKSQLALATETAKDQIINTLSQPMTDKIQVVQKDDEAVSKYLMNLVLFKKLGDNQDLQTSNWQKWILAGLAVILPSIVAILEFYLNKTINPCSM